MNKIFSSHKNYLIWLFIIIAYSSVVAYNFDCYNIIRYQLLNLLQILFLVIISRNILYILKHKSYNYNITFITLYFCCLFSSEVIWTYVITQSKQYPHIPMIILGISNILMYTFYITHTLYLLIQEKKKVLLKYLVLTLSLLFILEFILNHALIVEKYIYIGFISISLLILLMELSFIVLIHSKEDWISYFSISNMFSISCVSIQMSTTILHSKPLLVSNILAILGNLFLYYMTTAIKNQSSIKFPLNLEKTFYNTLMLKGHLLIIVFLTILFSYLYLEKLIFINFTAYIFILILFLSVMAFFLTRNIFLKINIEIAYLIKYFSSEKNPHIKFEITEFDTLKAFLIETMSKIERINLDKIALEKTISENKLNMVIENQKTHDLLNKKKLLTHLYAKDSEFRDRIALLIHDIKSPTLTIDSVISHVKTYNSFDDTDIAALSIANNKISIMVQHLLNEYKSISTLSHDIFFYVYLEINKIYQESQVIYRKINFQLNVDPEVRHSMFYGNKDTFESIILNIIKNACEAIPKDIYGLVTISLKKIDDLIEISIKDNGTGMSEHIKNRLLRGKINQSTKTNGIGAGSKQISQGIQSFCGIYEIDSGLHNGTEFRIKIPQEKSPSWAINKINLKKIKSIIILDDDPEIFILWKKMFQPFAQILDFYSFENRDQLNKFLSTINDTSNMLFLCDYQIGSENGMDIINQVNIANSILVTHLAYSPEVQTLVQQYNIKLLNKQMIPHLEIVNMDDTIIQNNADIVWLDDQEVFPKYLVHQYYQHLTVKIFSDVEEFMQNIVTFNKDATIILDNELSSIQNINNISRNSGIVIAQELYKIGFHKIIILSGNKIINVPSYVKAIIKEDEYSIKNLDKIFT